MNFPKGALSFLDIHSAIHSFIVIGGPAVRLTSSVTASQWRYLTSLQILGDWSCTVRKSQKYKKEAEENRTEQTAEHTAIPAWAYGWFPERIYHYDPLRRWLLRWFWHRAASGKTLQMC